MLFGFNAGLIFIIEEYRAFACFEATTLALAYVKVFELNHDA
jgi:hypothetical protein